MAAVDKYKIIRFYQHAEGVVTQRGLTFEEAQNYCRNPETSSSTATDPRVDERGEWFDGYEKESSEGG